MRLRLLYAIACCVLLASLVVANYRIDDLEKRSQFWQDAHTSLAQDWLEREAAWVNERNQWQGAVASRDDLVSWWESKPAEIIEKTLEVTVETEVVREVEKAVYPYRFADAIAAKAWVLSHRLPVTIIADMPNNLIDNIHDSRYDCDDYADDYEALALSENVSLWQAPVTNGCIWGIQVSKKLGNHVGMWTKIDNIYYYIEPQPIDDKWRFIKIMEAD